MNSIGGIFSLSCASPAGMKLSWQPTCGQISKCNLLGCNLQPVPVQQAHSARCFLPKFLGSYNVLVPRHSAWTFLPTTPACHAVVDCNQCIQHDHEPNCNPAAYSTAEPDIFIMTCHVSYWLCRGWLWIGRPAGFGLPASQQ